MQRSVVLLIGNSELNKVLHGLGFPFEGSVDAFFTMVDSDGSGFIEYEEFFDLAIFIQLLCVMFEAGTVSGERFLTPKELYELLKAMDMEISLEESTKVVEQLDTLKKGGLDFEEWVRLVLILRFG